MVTVASDTPTAPSVFPVTPCTSEYGDTVTLTCLATGFSPSSVSFSWTQNGSALSDSLQFPAVLQNKLYSGVSQVRVRRQDWDLRHSFKCRVEHAGGSKEVDFVKPHENPQLPSLKIMTMEESDQVTFSCLANHFIPNVFEFKWLKNGKVVRNASLEFTTPSKAESSDNGTAYSAASFLTLPMENLDDDTRMTCEFALRKGAKKQLVDSVLDYRTNKCPSSTNEGFDMKIIPPSWEDLLVKRNGEVRCEVTFPKGSRVNTAVNLFWRDEKRKVLMTPTDHGAQIIGKRIILPLDITYEEWSSGVRRTCHLDHDELLQPLERVYERKNEARSLKPPSVFMLPPLKQTREAVVTLTCYVKDFYPKELKVLWLIDDKDATHNFSTTNSMEALGAFEAYSRLSVPLSEWDVPERAYSCLVYHESLRQNKSYVRSITQSSPQQTTMVNLNMQISDRCKAQ